MAITMEMTLWGAAGACRSRTALPGVPHRLPDGGVMLTVGKRYHDVEVDQSKVPIDASSTNGQ